MVEIDERAGGPFAGGEAGCARPVPSRATAWWRWSAMASMTVRSSPQRISASPSAPPPTLPARPRPLVLPAGGLWMLPWVVDVARAVRRTILTNLIWAFGYNLVALTLAALGLLQPILAAAVMAGSSILVGHEFAAAVERLPGSCSAPIPEQPSGTAIGTRRLERRRCADGRARRSSGAEARLQPNMSWVKASYQPTASCAVWRRISALSPTLLTKVVDALILPVAPA